jgi:hypothetical protein
MTEVIGNRQCYRQQSQRHDESEKCEQQQADDDVHLTGLVDWTDCRLGLDGTPARSHLACAV